MRMTAADTLSSCLMTMSVHFWSLRTAILPLDVRLSVHHFLVGVVYVHSELPDISFEGSVSAFGRHPCAQWMKLSPCFSVIVEKNSFSSKHFKIDLYAIQDLTLVGTLREDWGRKGVPWIMC